MDGEEEKEEKGKVLLLVPIIEQMEAALIRSDIGLLKAWEFPDGGEDRWRDSVRAVLCRGVNCRVDAALIESLPRLGCVVTTSVGVNHIDTEECRRKGIVVGNTGAAYAVDVADYAVGLLLDVLRRMSASERLARRISLSQACCHGSTLGSKLGGKRVGVVGLGRIGSAIAKRLQAFGCIISYTSTAKKPWVPFAYFFSVIDLAAESDVLVLSCALTKETHHIVGEDVLCALGRDGVVINVGRGALIDEAALVRSLVGGGIAGAGLDVFENEPEVPQELLTMDNVVLSPHVAMTTAESLQAASDLIVANLKAFFENKPLPSQA